MATARRRGGSYRDMLLTLVIFVAGIVALVAFLPKSSKPQVSYPVAYAVPLASLRSAAPFPVYAPATAPAGWTANHVVTHVPTTAAPSYSLDLGFYIRARNQYVQLEQSNAAGFLAAELGGSARQGAAETVAGVSWQTWTDDKGEPALVRPVVGSTLVLDGVSDPTALRTLAGSLSLQPAVDPPDALH